MKIVFRNSHFIAVDKEAGVLSVPARVATDPRPILGHQLQEFVGKEIFPIHRLDAEVSGLVLYGLTAEAHREANLLFEHRLVSKTYQAFTSGGVFKVGLTGEWKAKILRGKKRAYESPGGKLAVTGYEVVSFDTSGIFEWRLTPKTGRSHQLRWEMYRHETPILGDVLYGSTRSWKQPGIGLRSLSLQLPDDFAKRFELPGKLTVEPW